MMALGDLDIRPSLPNRGISSQPTVLCKQEIEKLTTFLGVVDRQCFYTYLFLDH